MATIISSKNIYNYQNKKVVDNKISSVFIPEYVFTTSKSSQEFSLNFDIVEGNLQNFGEAEGYNDITFFTASSGRKYVSFNFEISLQEEITDLVNSTATYSVVGEYQDEATTQTFNFNKTFIAGSNEFRFSFVSSKEEFMQWSTSEPKGSYGDVALQRISEKSFLAYFNVFYEQNYEAGGNKRSVSNATLKIYADKKTTLQTEGKFDFFAKENQLLNEKNEIEKSRETLSYSIFQSEGSTKYRIGSLSSEEVGTLDISLRSVQIDEETKGYFVINLYNFFNNINTDKNFFNLISKDSVEIILGNLYTAYGKIELNNSEDGIRMVFESSYVGNKDLDWVRNAKKKIFFDYDLIEKEKISVFLSKCIKTKYENGKENATILCSIFDIEEGKMAFSIGDQVIPMVFGADGRDRPMSRYNDGSPKVFNVVGRKMIYDGAVWQELTLQEKTQGV